MATNTNDEKCVIIGRERIFLLVLSLLLTIPTAAQAVCSWSGPYTNVSPPLVISTSGTAVTQAQFDALAPVTDVTTDCGSYSEKVTTSYSLGEVVAAGTPYSPYIPATPLKVGVAACRVDAPGPLADIRGATREELIANIISSGFMDGSVAVSYATSVAGPYDVGYWPNNIWWYPIPSVDASQLLFSNGWTPSNITIGAELCNGAVNFWRLQGYTPIVYGAGIFCSVTRIVPGMPAVPASPEIPQTNVLITTTTTTYALAAACPAHASGSPCMCDAGYEFNATHTSCVSTCSIVADLSPLTDPVAIDFDANGNRWRPDLLTADYQTKLTCFQNGVTTAGGTYSNGSAYRPTQYQRHLFEIIDKDRRLDTDTMNRHPECQPLRDEVTAEMGPSPEHGLRHNQPVAAPGTSHHESGTAFDVTPSRLTDFQLAPIYPACGVTHTAVPGEPWHIQ